MDEKRLHGRRFVSALLPRQGQLCVQVIGCQFKTMDRVLLTTARATRLAVFKVGARSHHFNGGTSRSGPPIKGLVAMQHQHTEQAAGSVGTRTRKGHCRARAPCTGHRLC